MTLSMTSAAPGTMEEKPSNKTQTRRRASVVLPESSRDKVEQSWNLVADRLEHVGLAFFLRLFKEEPSLLQLFKFGAFAINDDTGDLQINESVKALIQTHAVGVMKAVGMCVAGLSNLDSLVPTLRKLGTAHAKFGVEESHYDIVAFHLLATLRDEVGPKHWDRSTEEAWTLAYTALTNVMKRPSTRLETEPLEGWGLIMALASLYFMVITPLQLAGFCSTRLNGGEAIADNTYYYLTLLLDLIAATCLFGDLHSDWLVTKSKFRKGTKEQWAHRSVVRKYVDRFLLRPRLAVNRTLRKWEIGRWVPWRSVDFCVLISFPLQYAHVMYVAGMKRSVPLLLDASAGLHWTQLFGLLRLATIARVLHALRCAETRALIQQRISEDGQVHVRISKLLLTLGYVLHLTACLWCIVARVEMGPDSQEPVASPYFPDTDILFGKGGRINGYVRAIHWGWVNLAGIGDVDSTPGTTLEVMYTLFVHLIGATLYAIVTGNVVNLLEEATQRNNKISADISNLSKLMEVMNISDNDRERIMHGYVMQNVVQQEAGEGNDGDESNPVDSFHHRYEEVSPSLPSHIRNELTLYSRAEALRRRDNLFEHCSNDFLFSLVGALERTRTLLAGDYLMEEKVEYDWHEVVMVERGCLQVCQSDGHAIRTLERGDVVGKGWLLAQWQVLEVSNGSEIVSKEDEFSEFTNWCRKDGTTGASIRATTACTLVTGLASIEAIEELKSQFPSDFEFLEASVRRSMRLKNGTHTTTSALTGIVKAQQKFKKRMATTKKGAAEDKRLSTAVSGERVGHSVLVLASKVLGR